MRVSYCAVLCNTVLLKWVLFQIQMYWNKDKVYTPSSVTNLFIINFSSSLTCFGPYGPSSEGSLETTKIPRSANCEKSSSPCFACRSWLQRLDMMLHVYTEHARHKFVWLVGDQ
jgi:hypothetical protein